MKSLTLAITLAACTTMFSFTYAGESKALPVLLYSKPFVSIVPTLVYPVAGKQARVGSWWGDTRDGGRRKHQGIDIFAKKHTPVVAVCDGYIIAVENAKRGGRTVWLKANNKPVTFYYAHLDKQLVRVGQSVRKGQKIGTVGNTGNARFTPSHLHFGIYTYKGAINPLPFVAKASRMPIAPDATMARKVSVKPGGTMALAGRSVSPGTKTTLSGKAIPKTRVSKTAVSGKPIPKTSAAKKAASTAAAGKTVVAKKPASKAVASKKPVSKKPSSNKTRARGN